MPVEIDLMLKGNSSEGETTKEETIVEENDDMVYEVTRKMLTYKAELFHAASQNIKDAQERMKKDYDRKRSPLSVSVL